VSAIALRKDDHVYPTDTPDGLCFGMLKIINSNGLDPVQWAVLLQQFEAGKPALQIAKEIGQTHNHVSKKLSKLNKQSTDQKTKLLAEAMRREFVALETALFSGDLEMTTKLARALVAAAAAFKIKEALMDHFCGPGESPQNETEKAQLSDDELAQLRAQIKRKLASIDESRAARPTHRQREHRGIAGDPSVVARDGNERPVAAKG
jgi:hypothetical protein